MNRQIFLIIIYFNIIFPCFSGGPYILENGFYYLWSDANVYSEPKFSSNIINNVSFNTRVEVLDYIDNYERDINNYWDYWYKVDINNSVGYIFGRYFTHEKIEHTDQNGNKYIIYIHYIGQNSYNGGTFDTESIKIFLNNNEISLIFPELHFNNKIYIENYSRNYIYNFSIYELNIYDNNIFFPVHHNDGEGVCKFIFNNNCIDILSINHSWSDKVGNYNSSLILKWDDENKYYYEIENNSNKLHSESEYFLNKKLNTDEDLNYHEQVNNLNSINVKPIKSTFINKYITFSIVLLIGIIVFILYIKKKKVKNSVYRIVKNK